MDYHIVSQGKTSIPGVDDGEECELTDVRLNFEIPLFPHKLFFIIIIVKSCCFFCTPSFQLFENGIKTNNKYLMALYPL